MSDAPNVVLVGFVASVFASLGTALGSLGVLFVSRLSRPVEDSLLSLAAGIMLAATFFSLLVPGLEYAEAQFESPVGGVAIVASGLLLGAGTLFLIHQRLPHEHFVIGREGGANSALARIWLFVIAITLHNFPEGMAVGVSFAGGQTANGLSLALGIGLQNLPEGLAVSVALLSAGYARASAFGVGALSGMVEPIGGLLGAFAVSGAAMLMPWALAFAAGAMLFVISDEIVPETHRSGNENLATFSLLVGFVVMMALDTLIG
jgi:ZIP family zinc transporter